MDNLEETFGRQILKITVQEQIKCYFTQFLTVLLLFKMTKAEMNLNELILSFNDSVVINTFVPSAVIEYYLTRLSIVCATYCRIYYNMTF